jgi:hypothetical protein
MYIKQDEGRSHDAVEPQGKQSELLLAGRLRPPEQNQASYESSGRYKKREERGGKIGMGLVGKNMCVISSDHEMPAAQGAREANAILLNGKDQLVSATAVHPLGKKATYRMARAARAPKAPPIMP